MTGRSVPEWIAKHPDQKVPARVRDRIFERHERRCYLSGREIRPGDEWHLDHITPLWLTGQHRESNLAPVLAEPHRRKTASEAAVKAKVDRMRQKHTGAAKPKSRFPNSRDGHLKTRLTSQGQRTGPR